MITVCCLYVGNKIYDIKYVENLSKGVKKNLTQEYQFVIFTDRKDQLAELQDFGKVVLLPSFNFNKAWWNKLWLFSKESGLSGTILYLDLDVIILGSLDKFITDKKFKIIHDFNRSNHPNWNKSNSSIMSWKHEDHTHLWGKFYVNVPNYTSRMHGDQDFIHLYEHDKEWYPDNWAISYRWEYLKGKLFDNKETSVLVLHGKPKPHELTDDKLLKIWNSDK